MKMKDVYKNFSINESHIKEKLSKSFSDCHPGRKIYESAEAYNLDQQPQNYGISDNIRTLFYKSTRPHNMSIGGHPDFNYLVNGETSKGYVVSLFMDIIGSTKLGLIYEPEEVLLIKNEIIRCAIETIHSFDGHVHRIMGDAILAFFRINNDTHHNSCIDAINCAVYLVKFFQELVIPQLEENGLGEDIGIRIGLDYGEHDRVIWAMYGYANTHEVTATSYFVDVAAKLQQAAPKNKIMLGQSLKEALDIHEELLDIKLKKKDDILIKAPFVTPNYINRDGLKTNYRQYILKTEEYFKFLPSPEKTNSTIEIYAIEKHKNKVVDKDKVASCAKVFKKGIGIEFKVLVNDENIKEDISILFRVENHGREAQQAHPDDMANHETFVDVKHRSGNPYFARHWEGAEYAGLHYMYISLWASDHNTRISEEIPFAVYVNS